MKRAFDIAFALVLGCILLPVAIIVAVAVWLTDYGPALFWSDRVGRNETIFKMPKFRTMRVNTPQLATHKMNDPGQWLTPTGPFLRRSSLDEIPQLWSILVGDMSVIGPRPALFNQDDLIALRREAGVNALRPGLTGWAQVNGRDYTSHSREGQTRCLLRQEPWLPSGLQDSLAHLLARLVPQGRVALNQCRLA